MHQMPVLQLPLNQPVVMPAGAAAEQSGQTGPNARLNQLESCWDLPLGGVAGCPGLHQLLVLQLLQHPHLALHQCCLAVGVSGWLRLLLLLLLHAHLVLLQCCWDVGAAGWLELVLLLHAHVVLLLISWAADVACWRALQQLLLLLLLLHARSFLLLCCWAAAIAGCLVLQALVLLHCCWFVHAVPGSWLLQQQLLLVVLHALVLLL
jgi:hypothetical protein